MRGEFLDLGGARIYYYASGTRGAGDPVVFVHGLATSGLLWRDVAPRVPEGHRVVVLDLLGHGRSDRPGSHAVTVPAHADRLIAVLDLLRIKRACLVGHDLGGVVVQAAAVRAPKRVSRLCLVNSAAIGQRPSRAVRLARHLPASWLLSVVRSRMLRGYVDRSRGARLVDRYVRPFDHDDGRAALVAHLKALAGDDTAAMSTGLGTLAIPTAILCGSDDPIVLLKSALRLHAAIPGSTLEVLPGLKHYLPDEAAGRLAEALARLLGATGDATPA